MSKRLKVFGGIFVLFILFAIYYDESIGNLHWIGLIAFPILGWHASEYADLLEEKENKKS